MHLTSLGACLAQKSDDNAFVPLCFASRTLNDTERRYSTTKKEALALVWSLKHFRFTIFGYNLTIFTDHRPLIGLFQNTLPPDPALTRWALQIQEFAPAITYLPGKQNVLADIMSRLTCNIGDSPTISSVDDRIDHCVFSNVVPKVSLTDHSHMPIAPVSSSSPLPPPPPHRRSARVANKRAQVTSPTALGAGRQTSLTPTQSSA